MRSQDLLQLYAQGERNFRGKCLKGRSFRGHNLSGIDLSRADLRGADFRDTILRDAVFSRAKTGFQAHHALALVIGLFLLAALLGTIAGIVDGVAEFEFHSARLLDAIPKWMTFGVLITFAFVTANNGIIASFVMFVVAFVIAAGLALIGPATVALAGAIAIAITIASFVAVATTALVAIAIAVAEAFNFALAALAILTFGVPFVLIAVPTAGESAVGLAVTVMTLSAWVSWRAIQGDERHALMLRVATALITRWGTSFRGADLTNADFTQTALRNVDFTEALLTNVHWETGTGSRYNPDLIGTTGQL